MAERGGRRCSQGGGVNDHVQIPGWLVFVIVGVCLLVFGAAFVGILDAFFARIIDVFA
jgi:hypothetical protein